MYFESYLQVNEERGEGNGLTPGSYLAYTLRGKAKRYANRYRRALLNALTSATDTYEAKSAKGGVAWYREKKEKE